MGTSGSAAPAARRRSLRLGVPHAWLLLAPAALALLVALGLQQAGFWLLAGTGEPSGEPGASGDETGAEPEPRADLHA